MRRTLQIGCSGSARLIAAVTLALHASPASAGIIIGAGASETFNFDYTGLNPEPGSSGYDFVDISFRPGSGSSANPRVRLTLYGDLDGGGSIEATRTFFSSTSGYGFSSPDFYGLRDGMFSATFEVLSGTYSFYDDVANNDRYPISWALDSNGSRTPNVLGLSPARPTTIPKDPPLFKQYLQPWGDDLTLNSLQYTMQQTGCFVTSTAMVLNAYGHNTDPRELNEFLRSYMPAGGSLYFNLIEPLESYGQTDGIAGVPVQFISKGLSNAPGAGSSVRQQVISQLKSIVDEQGPVIMRVPAANHGTDGYGTSSTHAIVAYKVEGDEVYIRDPGWSASPGTLDGYIDFVNDYVTNVKGRPEWQLSDNNGTGSGHDLSWLYTSTNSRTITYVEAVEPFSKTIVAGTVNSPVEVVITDPLGRRLGFDPVNGIFYTEIPDSWYYRELTAVDVTDLDTILDEHAPIQFTIGELLSGVYLFDVYGTGEGSWSINFGLNGPQTGFDPFQFTLSGMAHDGSFGRFSQMVNVPTQLSAPQFSFLFFGIVVWILFYLNRKRAYPPKPI